MAQPADDYTPKLQYSSEPVPPVVSVADRLVQLDAETRLAEAERRLLEEKRLAAKAAQEISETQKLQEIYAKELKQPWIQQQRFPFALIAGAMLALGIFLLFSLTLRRSQYIARAATVAIKQNAPANIALPKEPPSLLTKSKNK